MRYNICEYCGAALDCGERCDCKENDLLQKKSQSGTTNTELTMFMTNEQLNKNYDVSIV